MEGKALKKGAFGIRQTTYYYWETLGKRELRFGKGIGRHYFKFLLLLTSSLISIFSWVVKLRLRGKVPWEGINFLKVAIGIEICVRGAKMGP